MPRGKTREKQLRRGAALESLNLPRTYCSAKPRPTRTRYNGWLRNYRKSREREGAITRPLNAEDQVLQNRLIAAERVAEDRALKAETTEVWE